MGSSPIIALFLPMSVVIAAVVYLVTGSVPLAVAAFVLDVVPLFFVYRMLLRARRAAEARAQDRLTRYSSLDGGR